MDKDTKAGTVHDRTTGGATTTSRPWVTGGERAHKRTNRILIWVGAALVVALSLYFLGLSLGRGGLEEARADYETRLRNARTEAQQLQSQLASTRAINQLLVARGWLYRAAIQLDRRNFGLAQNYVKQAALTLERTGPRAAGMDSAQINALKQFIENTNILVAADIQSQRSKILQLAEQMDNLLKIHVQQASTR